MLLLHMLVLHIEEMDLRRDMATCETHKVPPSLPINILPLDAYFI